MDTHNMMSTAGGASSPTTSNRPGTGTGGGSYNKRKRSGVEFESSPGSGGEAEEEEAERRRQPGVKRACNECRQQKLRCDVVQDPFSSCSRCNRLKLECKIESNFKRVGKRSKHAEMEKQIERLRRNLQRAQAQGFMFEEDDELDSPLPNNGYTSHMKSQSFMGSDEAVSSLLHLKQSGSYGMPRYVHEIETVGLAEDTISHLFAEFFGCYHPYLPFLDPNAPSEQYYQQHPLLFWTIAAVAARRYTTNPGLLTSLSGPLSRLLWATVGSVPSNQEGLFVVKALCLLCTWPLPTSTTSTDPTHILCGVMMKTATGIGLHRPSYTQDFSRVSVDLSREQLHDRVVTWAVCNIVAQSIGTGYGQPASTLYDWALSIRPGSDSAFTLPSELEARLQIERFCDKVSKEMYSNQNDPRGVTGDEARALMTRIFKREFNEISVSILSKSDLSQIVNLHLKAAGLHLRLSAFFDSPSTKGYMDDLMGLWRATTAFLDLVFELESPPADNMTGGILRYATNYILQMIIAASFTLFKLLSSFFAAEIDFDRGRQLFHHTIKAIRSMSIINNDLPWRLAEIVVQMWNGARVEQRNNVQQMNNNGISSEEMVVAIDDTLQLKTRCRMSMSIVHDTTWRWREEFQAQGRGTIEGMKNPTNPDSSAGESSASSTHMDATLMPSHGMQSGQILGGTGTVTPNNGMANNGNMISGVGYGENNYEVFDPLNWMLDGLVDFPYSYAAVQGLEASGM
ncbi:C6 transcription factor [Phlyctema vagabunda]|uniref:C6 transcription factor n=1 Tax=Phlyctema vagabunda TaxID=108571 RepID=A0ABR4PR83_9HELO